MQSIRDFRATVRQWRQPREFRIYASVWQAETLPSLTELVDLLKTEQAPPDASSADTSANEADLTLSSIADVATNLWRLRRRLANSPDGDQRKFRRHQRDVEAIWDTLEDDGIKIQDHLGDLFDAGLSIKVLAFQPTAGLERDRVIETIRPTVYLRKQIIQTGEVIVGTPDSDPGPERSERQEVPR